MTNEQAFKRAIELISLYNPKAGWDFDSNLEHLNILTKYIPKNISIFDAGCGWGILALALTFLGYKVEGGDKYIFERENTYSIQDLEGIRKLWDEYGLKIKNMDILKDDVGKKYGAVISIATIEHQVNPKLFLSKLKEMVVDGGYIYIATPNITHLLNRIRFLFGKPPQGNLKEFFSVKDGGENFVGHFREYTLEDLKKMFEWSGIKIIEAKNKQAIKPKINFGKFRDIYVNLLRLSAYFLPGTRDANIILGKK